MVTAAVVLAALLGSAALPGKPGKPLRRVANVDAGRGYLDTPDPLSAAPLDAAALRHAGSLIRSGSVYLDGPPNNPQLDAHDLLGAATIFLAPAVPTSDAGAADWVLSYRARPPVPPGVRPGRIWRVAPGIAVIEAHR